MPETRKILFVHKGVRSFVRKDLEILKKHFVVRNLEYPSPRGILKNVWQQLRLLWNSLVMVPAVDGIFIWFAGYHSFFPVLFAKIFKKKVVIAIGGYETTYIPEIRYGVFSNPLRSFMARFSFENANFLVPVDESLIFNLKKFIPGLSTPYKTVATGYDANFWKPVAPKEKIVLTVGSINSDVVFKRKGIDIFVETCRQLPQYEFHIVGVEPNMRHRFPELPNLKVFPPANAEKLREYYSRAKVYAQFSMYEGLPNVVCEAMLCECIPVVTPVNGMVRQAEGCGVVLPERNTAAAVQAVQKAMEMPEDAGRRCRERAIEKFPFEKREKELVAIINRVIWNE